MRVYQSIRLIKESHKFTDAPLRILAVDDEEFNLEILCKHLEKAGYQVATAVDGEQAWAYLQEHPLDIDIVLLDKMMPKLDGLDVLKRMMAHPDLKKVTVIMQTAAVGSTDLIKCIEAGAYYYLTKPYTAEVLVSVVNAAARHHRQQNQDALEQLYKSEGALAEMTQGAEFAVRTPDEANILAAHIARLVEDQSRVALGLQALILNGIEHGNLGIGYELKTDLLNQGVWEEELQQRLNLPQNQAKRAWITVKKHPDIITVHIRDEGQGFQWKPYLHFDPTRITDPNGRGIALANITPGCALEFLGSGNEVLFTIQRQKTISGRDYPAPPSF